MFYKYASGVSNADIGDDPVAVGVCQQIQHVAVLTSGFVDSRGRVTPAGRVGDRRLRRLHQVQGVEVTTS